MGDTWILQEALGTALFLVFDSYLLGRLGCLLISYVVIYRNILSLKSSTILTGYLFMTLELRILMIEVLLELFSFSFQGA